MDNIRRLLVYAPGNYKTDNGASFEAARSWSYAVKAGDVITPQWPVAAFEQGRYHLRVYGPNGFYHECRGDAGDPALEVSCTYEHHGSRLSGDMVVLLHNTGSQAYTVHIKHYAYAGRPATRILQPGESFKAVVPSHKTGGWYDFAVAADGFPLFEKRYAGRVETGRPAISDPLIGEGAGGPE
jgi:phospholipase C